MKQDGTKLERLTTLRNLLIDIIYTDYAADTTGREMCEFMLTQAKKLLYEERKKNKWMEVYAIENGSAGDVLFCGREENCQLYCELYKEREPNAELIILNM